MLLAAVLSIAIDGELLRPNPKRLMTLVVPFWLLGTKRTKSVSSKSSTWVLETPGTVVHVCSESLLYSQCPLVVLTPVTAIPKLLKLAVVSVSRIDIYTNDTDT